MKPEWRAFLTDAGAEFVDERVQSFGNPNRERQISTTGTVICDLSHTGLISAYGNDTRDFLHNQLTSDVNAVGPDLSQLSAYCSPKGRMIAFMRLFMRQEAFYLRLPREILESTLKRLRMFVLRSQVTLEDADDSLVRFGLAGPDAEAELEAALGRMPGDVDEAVELADVSAVRVPGAPHPRFELYGELETMQQLWERFNVRGAPVGADNWRLLDILAGLPNVFAATQEAFVPQMANLDLINAVSFKKGCYPGQEVIARMHYLGKPNRRMFLAVADTEETPAPDTAVVGEDGKPAGEVVSAAPHPDSGQAVLAVMKLKPFDAGGPFHLGEDGPALEFRELPYPVPR